MVRTLILKVILQAAACLFSTVCSFFDIKRQSIPVRLLLAGAAAGVVLDILSVTNGLWTAAGILAGLLPGSFLISAAFVTGEKIGYGDGAVFLILGMLLGAERTFAILFTALFLSGIAGGILIMFRKASFSRRIPFIPFAAVSVIGACTAEWLCGGIWK